MARRQDEDRVVLGHLIATPMRERGERDGRMYWRIRTRDTRATVAAGWWTRAEVDLEIATALRAPRTPRSAPAAVRTVGDLLTAWRDAQVRRHEAGEIAERTLAVYRTAVRHWLSTGLAEVVVGRLSRPAVVDQATAWRADGVADRTVDLAVRILRQAAAWGADRQLCPDVDLAIREVARDDEHVYCGRVPTRDELSAVLDAIRPGPRRDAIEILGLTGARVGEIVALRVGDVDLDARTLRITGRDEERGRRGKVRPRLFPLRARLLDLCRRLAADRPAGERLLALPRSGDHLLHTELTRASTAAGVEPVTPHGIRRLVVDELLETAGGDAKRVSLLTGHSVVVLLRRYVRPSQADLGSLVERAQLGEESRDNVRPIRARRAGTRGGDRDGEGTG